MNFDFNDFKVQGIKFNYYFICKRKLWLFDKGIALENNSDRVLQGKVVHEASYNTAKYKEKLIDNMIKVDILQGDKVKEVKISSKMTESDKMQILYYLFYLKQLGINKKGSLNYVKEKKVFEVELNEGYENKIKETLIEIRTLLEKEYPPKVEKLPYCKKCAYYEFCYVKEID
ncbi:CRISPR-associated protein Cas4 [Clostridium carnis]